MIDNRKHVSDCKRVAIMGGTFDPIHYGHLAVAEAVRHVYDLEKVLFIPAGQPPHKESLAVTNSEYRYLMTLLAIGSNPYFEVSRIEVDKPGLTYTVDTVTELRARYPGTKLYFITGADAVQQILTWKDPDRLLSLCSFVAVTRPGYHRECLSGHVQDLKTRFPGRVHLLEVPGLAISSSDLRRRASLGEPVKYLLPEGVERCMIETGLYRPQRCEPATDLTGIVRYIKSQLGESRYTHTMGTAGESVRLSEKYGADPMKAYTAALLHDCAKDLSKEERKALCKAYGIKPDDVMRKQPDLIHGYLSAEIARSGFSVTDADMLNAIRYHTTGRRGMSLIEKIIYLADGIEPNRMAYPGLLDIRAAAHTDLDQALYIALDQSIRYNRQKGRLVHPLSIEALAYYKNTGKKGKHGK